MYIKILITIIIINIFSIKISAQENQNSKKQIVKKMSMFKHGFNSRKVEIKERLFLDLKTTKKISPKKLPKDSIRHFLICNGFYDFNFEYFQITLRNISELEISYIKDEHPKLYLLMQDSSYNNLTYNYSTFNNNIIIDAILSKNVIQIDSIKDVKIVLGVGYYSEKIIFKGTSNVDYIFQRQDDDYLNITKKSNKIKQRVILNEHKRFEATFDVSSHKKVYGAIFSESGNILSVMKIY